MDLLWEGNPKRVPNIEEVVNNNDPAQAWVFCKAPTTPPFAYKMLIKSPKEGIWCP